MTLALQVVQLVLTLVVAVAAAWIAFQQMIIARQKLNHDLFDRRYAVYVAGRNCIIAAMNSRALDEPLSALGLTLASAPFLFDESTNTYLRDIYAKTAEAQTFLGAAIASKDRPEGSEYLQRKNDAVMWLAREFESGEYTRRFQELMSISQISPFSMREMLRIPPGFGEELAAAFKTVVSSVLPVGRFFD